jgi:hypothetical protein
MVLLLCVLLLLVVEAVVALAKVEFGGRKAVVVAQLSTK